MKHGHEALKKRSSSHLDVAPRHVLQHPDAMGPGVVVAGVTAGGVTAHLHLHVECPGQMVAELLAPLCVALLLSPAVVRCRALMQDLLQHPASAGRRQPLLGPASEHILANENGTEAAEDRREPAPAVSCFTGVSMSLGSWGIWIRPACPGTGPSLGSEPRTAVAPSCNNNQQTVTYEQAFAL